MSEVLRCGCGKVIDDPNSLHGWTCALALTCRCGAVPRPALNVTVQMNNAIHSAVSCSPIPPASSGITIPPLPSPPLAKRELRCKCRDIPLQETELFVRASGKFHGHYECFETREASPAERGAEPPFVMRDKKFLPGRLLVCEAAINGHAPVVLQVDSSDNVSVGEGHSVASGIRRAFEIVQEVTAARERRADDKIRELVEALRVARLDLERAKQGRGT